MDVGENSSVLDRVNLTFIYDDIGLKGSKLADERDVVSRCTSSDK